MNADKPIYRKYKNGDQEWILNNMHHREDGPALIFMNGTEYWFKHGLHHREDGPAITYPYPQRHGRNKWYINGWQITDKKDIALFPLKDNDLVYLKLKYGQ